MVGIFEASPLRPAGHTSAFVRSPCALNVSQSRQANLTALRRDTGLYGDTAFFRDPCCIVFVPSDFGRLISGYRLFRGLLLYRLRAK